MIPDCLSISKIALKPTKGSGDAGRGHRAGREGGKELGYMESVEMIQRAHADRAAVA